MLGELFPEDEARGRAITHALTGEALGVFLGPPIGGIMDHFLGKYAPFLLLTVLAFIGAIFQVRACFYL